VITHTEQQSGSAISTIARATGDERERKQVTRG